MKTFSIGGVHPHDNKISANAAIESFPIPEVAYISMGQHLGAPAEPIVAAGDKVQLIGFGTFELRERAEKQARNPRTGEKMTVPACKAPAFKAGQAFKDAAK